MRLVGQIGQAVECEFEHQVLLSSRFGRSPTLLVEGGIRLTLERWEFRALKNTPRRSRTPNLLIRSQTLYPIELWAHFKSVVKPYNLAA